MKKTFELYQIPIFITKEDKIHNK